MSTWSFESASPLAACGMDAERVERFEKLTGQDHPWPMIFSPREAAHIGGLPHQASGFCASFCCKEALLKAIERSYPFPECELFYEPAAAEQTLHLSPSLGESHGIAGARVRLLFPVPGEMVAVVHLFEKAGA